MSLRHKLRAIVPAPLDLAQKTVRTAAHRLGLWGGLLRDCRGVTPSDQAILIRSFRAGLPHLGTEPGAWREPRLIRNATITVKDGFTFSIRAHTDDLGHIRQTTHRQLLEAVAPHLPAGGTAIDAGSNIGIFAANFARMAGPSGRVIAVEMMPATAQSLKQTIALNDLRTVEVVENALSDAPGQTLTIGMPDEAHFGQASIVRNKTKGNAAISVTTTTLDAITAGIERVNVIKMDLEGAEAIALAGATRTLQITDAILYETSPGDDDIDAVLLANGFAIRRIDGLNKLAEKIRS
ncbi:FkbM family methyltransferase [Porphyrobacter sp. ULC335]|uniref:FkbM family methyltransferase n=1 Tax=Porphyrobacter sp. ULC335 TaxID=2854260 RepID=UPI00222063C1|nr:FkbM family methyltransferase [Porphyrobacter sp. ULC335]UYV14815.1 FkbM family methyltransferase [Porphyrobacter sp. ULC335]